MKKFEQNIPESYKVFKRKFLAEVERSTKKEHTIFHEHIDVAQITDELILEHYGYFTKNYRGMYDSLQDMSDKTSLILDSIHESYFQETFNRTLDGILEESDTISLSTEFILENTTEAFPYIKLEKVGDRYLEDKIQVHTIEENIFAVGAGVGAGLAGAGVLGSLGVAGIVGAASAFFMPARTANNMENTINEFAGKILGGLIGAGNIFTSGYTGDIGNSHRNIINFDNIDSDPSVKKLFNRIQRTGPNVKEARSGLEALVAECVEQNKNILADATDEGTKIPLINLLRTDKMNPKDYNVIKLFYKTLFGKANQDQNTYGSLLRFRKCLSTKLVDVYKLLLISNLENNRDHKRIIDSISRSHNNPEQILRFVPGDTEEDKKLQESILALVQFRIYLSELADQLTSGFFSVDQEAGKFLKQKLSTVDGEVENYLRLNTNKQRNTFEGNLMSKKPVQAKRSLLSMGSRV